METRQRPKDIGQELKHGMTADVNGKTRIFAVIGCPIEHSVSPQLHNSIYRELGMNCIYVPFRVEPGCLEAAVRGFKALNVAGFNVTVPHKQSIIPLLDEIDAEAELIGAVNTVKNENGRLCGYNTDAEGFARAFREESGTGFRDKKVAILGAGGAARALAIKIALEGAAQVGIINRTEEKARDIARLVNEKTGGAALAAKYGSLESREIFAGSDIVINTTPVGMYPELDRCPLDDTYDFHAGQIAYDAIYNPAKTLFLSRAEQKGCIAVNGLRWLFYQGIYAFEIWTGKRLDEEIAAKLFDKFSNTVGGK